ncbi:MAG: agmatine deiminase family protein [Candidatus Nanopelagicales bacterium]|nr:agmatine deiminase family protein [Candidatus Nanopelagicales bacterium]
MHALPSTPAADGFRMPAEWEPHAGCYLVWPERPDTWRLGAKPAQAAWTAVIAAIATTEPVTVLVSAGQYRNARERLPRHVRVVETSTNDAWVRDTGPTFVTDAAGELRAVSWRFNAWGGLRGGLYFPWDADDVVGPKVADLERCQRYLPDLVLEGGAIDVDGQGTVLTTQECLRNPNRNPELGGEQIEALLREHLGVSQVLWLPRGVVDDETDGHVDNFARFAAPGVVLLTWTEGRAAPVGRRPARGLLRERLPRQRHRRAAGVRRPARRRGGRDLPAAVPGSARPHGPGSRDPARRGERALHHPAGAGGPAVGGRADLARGPVRGPGRLRAAACVW